MNSTRVTDDFSLVSLRDKFNLMPDLPKSPILLSFFYVHNREYIKGAIVEIV